MFPEAFVPLPHDVGFVSKEANTGELAATYRTQDPKKARETIKEHGTPLRLLELFYKKLGVRLVLFQGADCRYVHTPPGWETRPRHE